MRTWKSKARGLTLRHRGINVGATTTRGDASVAATSQRVQTSVVVPVHNEAKNIPTLVEELAETFREAAAAYRPWELIFVEDGSTDGTADLVDGLAAEHDHISAIHLRRSWGQSAALAAGFDAARGDYIVPMDGDLQNDPADIPALLAEIARGADCVSGWRRDRDDPWHKTIPSAIQTRLAKLTGPDINDFGCTLTAYRTAAIDELDLRGERHRYIPAQLHELGYDVTEVEVNHRPRVNGESRYGAGRLVRGFVDLLYHVFAVRFRTRPMHFFGGVGLFLFFVGGLLGGWLLLENYLLGEQLLPNLPQLVLAVALSMFGFGFLALGLVVELLMEIRYANDTEFRVERVVE